MIEFRDVYKEYDTGTKVLCGVNLKIEKGEFVYIVGGSGAGKSTFLKLIMREETPTSGEVIVNGFELSKMRRRKVPHLRRTMGIVFQDFRLINTMKVYDNVAFAMRAVGASERVVRTRVPYVLGLVELTEKMRSGPMELSGGEQQRVSLARALVNNPSIIIADEPTGNLDVEMSQKIMRLLTEINRLGITVLMVTHDREMVAQFPHRTVEIKGGVVISDTTPREAPLAVGADKDPAEIDWSELVYHDVTDVPPSPTPEAVQTAAPAGKEGTTP